MDYETVKLVSKDNQEFSVSRKALKHSRLLCDMMDTLGNRDEVIPLPDIDSRTLELICKWFMLHENDSVEYNSYVRNATPYQRIPGDIALFGPSINVMDRTKIVNAANYLNIPRLTDAVLAEVAEIVSSMELRDAFEKYNIPVDVTAEELAAIHEQNPWFKF